MKKIYVLLMHTNTKPAEFVKFMTHYEYSHVAISLNEECNKIYSFGRRNPYSIVGGGFTAENKDGEFFKLFNKTKCKIYEVLVSDEQYRKVEEIIRNMELNVENYKYDFWGIGFRFFKFPVTFKNKYVCSYFVAYVLEKSNIYKFNKKICFVKPKDFENLNGLKEIYSGQYALYNK